METDFSTDFIADSQTETDSRTRERILMDD